MPDPAELGLMGRARLEKLLRAPVDPRFVWTRAAPMQLLRPLDALDVDGVGG